MGTPSSSFELPQTPTSWDSPALLTRLPRPSIPRGPLSSFPKVCSPSSRLPPRASPPWPALPTPAVGRPEALGRATAIHPFIPLPKRAGPPQLCRSQRRDRKTPGSVSHSTEPSASEMRSGALSSWETSQTFPGSKTPGEPGRGGGPQVSAAWPGWHRACTVQAPTRTLSDGAPASSFPAPSFQVWEDTRHGTPGVNRTGTRIGGTSGPCGRSRLSGR